MKICHGCETLMICGICLACGTGAAGSVFHGAGAVPGPATVTAPGILRLSPASWDRREPWHTETTSGLRTDVDYVTRGSLATDWSPQPY
jgi:hypothetical protein